MKRKINLDGVKIRAAGEGNSGVNIPALLGLYSEDVSIQAASSEGNGLPKIAMLAYTGAAIRQIWSYDPVVINLEGIELPAKAEDVPVFANHDVNQGVGHATKLFMAADGLHLEGVASRATAIRDEIVKSSANGFKWKASIGCGDLVAQYVEEGTTLSANGREFPGPCVYIVRCKLKEVSFVSLAADPDTEAIAAADQERETIMAMLKKLVGVKVTASDPAGQTPAASGAPAPAASAAPSVQAGAAPAGVPDVVAQMRLQAAAETERITAIRNVTAGHPEIEAQAIREGWTPERAELHALRAARPAGVNILIPGANPNTNEADILAAAVCQTCGLRGVEKGFTAQALEAADKQFHGAIGLNQLLHMVAVRAGYTGDHYFRSDSALRNAIKAAFSSNTLSSVLSNVANKFIMEAFYAEENVWQKVAKIRTDVQNFKEYETWARISQLRLQKLAGDGKIKHGSIGDSKFTNQIDTYAILLGIPRKAFIDDDIGILASVAGDFGQGSAESLNEVFWAEFQDDAAFFTAANGNYLDGAGSAMSESSLKAAFTKFRDYTRTVDGKTQKIGMPAKYILTGTTLEWTVNEWMKGTAKVTGATTPVVSANLLNGQAEPLVTRYITSSTAWYLLADPARRPVMEVGFLRGKTKPTIEEVEPDADMLGVTMRAYWDFGCRKQVPQGGLKVKGSA